MTRLRVLLVLIGLAAACDSRAEPFSGPLLNQQLIAGVTTTALAFMGPRTLDPVSLPQMAIWGLRGLTTLDPRLTPELVPDGSGATLRLTLPGRTIFTRPAPPADDTVGWGEAIGQAVRAAWDSSEPVRRAGTSGIIDGFFSELFNHFDPYSRYTPPAEAEDDRTRRAGRAGVGITVSPRNRVAIVTAVQAGGPAALAGIRPGDQLLEVDGQPVHGADQQSLQALLNGPEDSEVTLSVRGPGRDARPRVVELTRTRIPPETVTAERLGDAVLIRMTGFSANTGARLAQELIRFMAATPPPRGVILDLRGNRGGLLRQAVAAAAMLQRDGVVAGTAGRDPEAAHEFRADGRDLAGGLPVVVLVDGRTASSAEILAASLADQRRAVVVGSATLGKGLVQTITPLPDGGELLITWSRVLAPRGWPIQGLGVLPEVCTSLGPEALARQLASLARGIQPMEAALARHRNARPPVSASQALDIRNACPAAEQDARGGRESDLTAARFLLNDPTAYEAALLPVLAAMPPMPTPRLTQPAPVRN